MAVTEREQAGADLEWMSRARVHRLGDIREDDTLLLIGRDVETMPSYMAAQASASGADDHVHERLTC